MRIFRLIILLAIALAATSLDPAAAQAPVKIRAGWVSTPASLIPLLFLKPGVTRHYGKSYIFEPMYFASSTLQITAISQGELDLAAFGYTSFPPSSLGRIALSFWAVRQPFLDRNRAALVDLMEDYATMLRWFYDANNHDAAVGIVARFLKRPPALFADWLFTRKDFYRDLDGKPDLSVVQQSIDRVQEVGFIKQTIDVSKYADLSLLDEAAKRRR